MARVVLVFSGAARWSRLAVALAASCVLGCVEKLPESAFGLIDAANAADTNANQDAKAEDLSVSEPMDGSGTEDIASGQDTLIAGDASPGDGKGDAAAGGDALAVTDTATVDDVAADVGTGADALDGDTGSTDAGGSFCTPNAKSCIGNVIAICNPAGTSWVPGEDCENTGKSCDDGVCQAPQSGFAGHGGFINAPSASGGGFRVIRQGFGSREVCGGGHCVRGGLRP